MPATGAQRVSVPAEQHTLWEHLLAVADRHSEKEALVSVDTDGREHRVTFGEVVERANSLSAGLARVGVRRGDRLALWMTNLPDWVYCYYAAIRLGAVVVPVNTWLRPNEIAYVLGQSRSRHLIMLDGFRNIDFPTMLSEICPEWPESAPGRLSSLRLPELRSVITARRDGTPTDREDTFDLLALLDAGDDPQAVALADEMATQVRPDDLALIMYTSGSTGFPKGVMLEQRGIVQNGLRHTERLEVSEGHERWFSSMPFFHVGGSIWGLMTTLTRGSTLVFTEAWDPVMALQLLERERCTTLFGATTMLRDVTTLLRGGGHDLSSLRMACGGDLALVDEIRSLVPSVTTTINPYGMTETYGAVAVCGPGDPTERQTHNCGRPFEGIECRVVAPGTNRDVAPGTVGEVLIRGPVMRGYWDNPEESARAIDVDGWLHPEDLVTVDVDGYVTYVGRLKAMLKVGGENVAAEEVENCILAHPAVRECVLVGIPDPRKDQVGRAYVVRDSHEEVNDEALRAWCAERLARFKVPAQFMFVDSLPKTGSGKVNRAAVEAMADASHATVGS